MKINIAVREGKEKGKTFHFEAEVPALIGMKIGETVKGEDIMPRLKGYEFEITGASDKAGFPALPIIEGTGLFRLLLRYGKGMKERKKGLRKRKTIRGNTISASIAQVNLVVKKFGQLELSEIFKKEEKVEKAAETK